jgi:hypothetical protein
MSGRICDLATAHPSSFFRVRIGRNRLIRLARASGAVLAPAGRVPTASTDYRPRMPERDVLRRVISEHLETFLDRAAAGRDGEACPAS